MKTFTRWFKAIMILPFNALVTLPALTLWMSGEIIGNAGGSPALYIWRIAAGCLLFACGLPLAIWTMMLFHRQGKGTPAPWDPPQKFVVAGPYCHTRNPMMTSVFIMQFAETLLIGSWALLGYTIVFICINLIYLPLFEEKELLRRFGDDYAKFKANVPRYIPRLKPWKG